MVFYKPCYAAGFRETRVERGLADEKGLRMVRGMAMSILKEAEIEAALKELPGWRFERDALAKTFSFGSFKEALSFMVRVGFEAEAINHHPEWTNVYNRVDVRLNTHDAGGKVTARDVELAQRIGRISWVP